MTQMNSVYLRGNLGRDPQKKTLPSGYDMVSFSLAVNRKYKSGNEWKNECCFVDVVVYGRQGEWVMEQCSKGSPVVVQGRLSFRSWEAQDGSRRTKHEVVANNVHFLAARPKSQGTSNGAAQQQGQAQTHNVNTGGGAEFDADDLPFRPN